MFDWLSLTRPQLTQQLREWGFGARHALRLWQYLYVELVYDPLQWHDLPQVLRERVHAAVVSPPLRVHQETQSDGGETRKYLLELHDGRRIETVLMRYGRRTTACLSSQAGCALDCAFCATGRMGFERNLTTAEITAQVLHAMRESRRIDDAIPKPLTNVVLMGMGEPLLNYDAVLRAVEILQDSAGPAVGRKQITLSTVGVVPGIIRLADERRGVSLAVSLHAADQAERAAIVPAARTWPLAELLEACRYYTSRLKRKVFFEWTLIHGVNDTADQARALAQWIRGMPAQVNLIPLNPVAGYAANPADRERIDRFRAVLDEQGVPVSIRRRRGIDIDAGCGQLAASSR